MTVSLVHSRFRYDSQKRQGLDDLLAYFDRVKEGDVTVPSDHAQTYLAAKLDESAQKAYDELTTPLLTSSEHARRVAEMRRQPRCVGNSSPQKAILKGCSAFEQMVALKEWLETTEIRKQHTFCLAYQADDYIPVTVKKAGTMMQTILGSTKGSHKAPKYEEWAENDPWQSAEQKRFIYALEGLEIVRQPAFVAATALKGNAFEVELIDEAWRYGAKKACVELKGQSKDSPQKRKSAGQNLAELTVELADATDPTASEPDIACGLKYENYAGEGYKDEVTSMEVSPGKLIMAAHKAVVHQKAKDLDRLMEKLVIAKIGAPATPALQSHIVVNYF